MILKWSSGYVSDCPCSWEAHQENSVLRHMGSTQPGALRPLLRGVGQGASVSRCAEGTEDNRHGRKQLRVWAQESVCGTLATFLQAWKWFQSTLCSYFNKKENKSHTGKDDTFDYIIYKNPPEGCYFKERMSQTGRRYLQAQKVNCKKYKESLRSIRKRQTTVRKIHRDMNRQLTEEKIHMVSELRKRTFLFRSPSQSSKQNYVPIPLGRPFLLQEILL